VSAARYDQHSEETFEEFTARYAALGEGLHAEQGMEVLKKLLEALSSIELAKRIVADLRMYTTDTRRNSTR
jgi:hypothetical protein